MIELKYLSKTFQMKDGAVKALQNINLTIPDGAIYGIIGMSGAGKSTLVRCINLLERPTGGSVVIDGVAMETLSPASLRKRRREITMIFQQFNLLMQRTCLKNVCFPMELAGVKKAEAEKRQYGARFSFRIRYLPFFWLNQSAIYWQQSLQLQLFSGDLIKYWIEDKNKSHLVGYVSD